jgi:hypothetical protein
VIKTKSLPSEDDESKQRISAVTKTYGNVHKFLYNITNDVQEMGVT